MGHPVRQATPESAPPVLEETRVVFVRDASLRLELAVLAADLRRAHPGSTGITPNSLAREMLWHAIRDPRIRAKLRGASTG